MDDPPEQPFLMSKSAIRAKQTPLTPVVAPLPPDIAPVVPKKKRTLSEKEMQQRKGAAESRVKKQAKLKTRRQALENFARLFDEDEEGAMRRLTTPSDVVHQEPVQEEPMVATPAAQEMPKESGLTENPTVEYKEQAYSTTETQNVLANRYVRNRDYFQVPSLASYQRFSRRIQNEVYDTTLEQGVLALPLPTFHQSG